MQQYIKSESYFSQKSFFFFKNLFNKKHFKILIQLQTANTSINAQFLYDVIFQQCRNHASPAERQFRYRDPRDAEGFLQCRIRCRHNSHDHHWGPLYILYANSRSFGVRTVQEEKSAVHVVSGDRGIRLARRTDVPKTVLQSFYVSTLCFFLV